MRRCRCNICNGEIDWDTMVCKECGMNFRNLNAIKDDEDDEYKYLLKILDLFKFKKKYIVIFLVAIIIGAAIMASCFKLALYSVSSSSNFYVDDYFGDEWNNNKKQESEYQVGSIVNLEQKDTMKTAFFEFKINDISDVTQEDLGLPILGDNKCFAININIYDVLEQDINMNRKDFVFYYGKDEDIAAPIKYMGIKNQLQDEYKIKSQKNIDGNLIFAVPNDVDEGVIEYTEYFSDDSVGNVYRMSVKLNQKQ